MGGGRQMLQTNVKVTDIDPLDTWAGHREDGLDLIEYWKEDKKNRSLLYSVVQNNDELAKVDLDNTDYLLGIFANGHIPMDYMRDKSARGQPSLEEMTRAALKVLQKSSNGYLLVVSSRSRSQK